MPRNNQLTAAARERAVRMVAGGASYGEAARVVGTTYVLTDIGMRMLAPRELFRANGFPDSYIIAPIVNGKPLTKTSQVRLVGNSVPPQWADALVKANFRHELEIDAA